MIDSELKSKILSEGFRAPTVHNAQPWRIRLSADEIVLYSDKDRELLACDPKLHDHEVSLGALIESIDLVLRSKGLGITTIRETNHSGGMTRERCRIGVGSGFSADPLVTQLGRRKCFRGKFLRSTSEDKLELEKKCNTEDSGVITDELARFAEIYDQCSYEINCNFGIQSELFDWLRLRPTHPRYLQDGLNREALALNSIEGFFADLCLRPKMYRFLSKLGLAKALVSEAPQILSSTGLVVIFKTAGASPMTEGRKFLRTWLSLTQAGFFATPLSAMVDVEIGRSSLEARFQGRQILNVLRVGRAPIDKIYTSPRRKVAEITDVGGIA